MSDPFDILTENVISLVKEHDRHLRGENEPDGNDINELVAAMSMSLNVLIQNGVADNFVLVSVIVTYMRTAYGLGFNRGYGKGDIK